MSRAERVRLDERPPEFTDPIWYLAFPAYYLTMTGYGVTAVLFPLVSVSSVQGDDRAQIFGLLIALVGAAMFIGTMISLRNRQRPHFEWVATGLFLVLMAIYAESLYHAVLHHEPNARPGSTFLPILFALFPFARWIVILRSGRIKWTSRLARMVGLGHRRPKA